MKYRVIEEKGMYTVMYKKAWYTRWKYIKDIKNPTLIYTWNSKRRAQAYINFLPKKK